MGSSFSGNGLIRFGVFEADLRAGELSKRGRRVKLEGKPFQVLAALLRRPDEVVTRDELQRELWSADTFVEFDHSLNTAVNKIRDALGDSAQNPTFIETLHRRGYRFIAPVEPDGEPALSGSSGPAQEVQQDGGGRTAAGNCHRTVTVAAVAVLTGIALGIGSTLLLRSLEPGQEVPRRTFSYTPGPNVRDPAISPDGGHIVYVAGQESTLWIQDLDEPRPREIEDTAGAMNPFWSPDSGLVGYVTASAREPVIKKVSLHGGRPATICRLPERGFMGFITVTWSRDGDSVVASGGFARTLYSAPARGGKAGLLPTPPERRAEIMLNPHFLPGEDGRRVIAFSAGRAFAASEIVVQDSDTGQSERLVEGVRPVYSPSGHILYRPRDSRDLWALPYSVEMLKPAGDPFLVAENVESASVANDGTLVYLELGQGHLQQLVWLDRNGKRQGSVGKPQPGIRYPSLSPDERLVAVSGGLLDDEHQYYGSLDIWIHEVDRPLSSRLTFDSRPDVLPLWSPKTNELLFSKQSPEETPMYLTAADGGGEPRLLLEDSEGRNEPAFDWSADGNYVVYRSHGGETGPDIWYLKRDDSSMDYERVPFLQTKFGENAPKLSPDSRFIAYYSDESGQGEIYVREFPGGGAKVLISRNGGTQPRWSRDGKELFYVEGDALIAVPLTTEPAFSAGSPKRLFRHAGLAWGNMSQQYDVSADGARFLVIEELEPETPGVIRVVQNWYAEFRDQAGGVQ